MASLLSSQLPTIPMTKVPRADSTATTTSISSQATLATTNVATSSASIGSNSNLVATNVTTSTLDVDGSGKGFKLIPHDYLKATSPLSFTSPKETPQLI